MRMHGMARGVKLALLATLGVTTFGFVVMGLWNWLVPDLFGWRAIGFWQALGLLVLSKILLGWHGGAGVPMSWRRRMIERYEQMTPEEREKFREISLRGSSSGGPPATESKT